MLKPNISNKKEASQRPRLNSSLTTSLATQTFDSPSRSLLVPYQVPFPIKCPRCEYHGFSELYSAGLPDVTHSSWSYCCCSPSKKRKLNDHRCYECKKHLGHYSSEAVLVGSAGMMEVRDARKVDAEDESQAETDK